MKKTAIALALFAVSFGAFAGTTTQTVKFNTCVQQVNSAIAEPGAEFKIYADNKSEKTVVFARESGSLTVRCLKAGDKKVTTIPEE